MLPSFTESHISHGSVGLSSASEFTPLEAHLRSLDLASLAPNVDFSDFQKAIPALAKDEASVERIESLLCQIPTEHRLLLSDARNLDSISDETIHLIVTSPPYWNLKNYRDTPGQLGHLDDYETFLDELDKVWRECWRVLVKGGRLVIVVGDVCMSRRKHGRHMVMPLHASIQERCRLLNFDNLAPIIWYKIANAAYEVSGNSGFLGKPYEPNGVIKNDIKFILMQRKPGAYRSPSSEARILSVISQENQRKWFQQIWSDVPGESTRHHPAPFPLELATRLIRMFSFAGDTVLDPFAGTGTTTIAASTTGRNSIGIEIDQAYLELATKRALEAGIKLREPVYDVEYQASLF